MNSYFTGALSQLIEKGRILNTLIPRDLPRDVDILVETCKRLCSERIRQLQRLINDSAMSLVDNEPERLREYKRISRELDIVENVGIMTLNRWRDEDNLLNRLTYQLSREIKYPLSTPVVATLSKDFYCTYPGLNLLLVPLFESKCLLYLPLLAHELAHHILASQNDPLVEPFLMQFCDVIEKAMDYMDGELQKARQRHEPQLFEFYLKNWKNSWLKWASELFCDLFAVFSLGVAFVWSSLHYGLQYGGNPLFVPKTSSSHPTFGIRIDVMLRALRLMDFNKEANQIEQFWDKCVFVSEYNKEPEYLRCFPDTLLNDIVNKTIEAFKAINCSMITDNTEDSNIRAILNSVWESFWASPEKYIDWEKEQIILLKERYCSANNG